MIAILLAATTTLFTIPPGNYGGTFTVPPSDIPAGAVAVQVSMDTTIATDPATGFFGSFDVSYDGGQNWQFWTSAAYVGGLYLDRQGHPRTWSITAGLDQPSSSSRMVRGSIVITGTVPIGGGLVVAISP